MKKINVILSTYNGEKYLRMMLDSIIRQTYQNIVIYVRDDGSSDNTPVILQEYHNQLDDKMVLIEDGLGNLGYVNSFFQAIRSTQPADYYCFCDQDDVWLPNKIENAVNCLEKFNQQECLLISSAYYVCDENLNIIDKGHPVLTNKELDLCKSMMLYDGGWMLGFTEMFNHTLKEKAFSNSAEDVYSHDIWVQSIALAFHGKIVYDSQPSAYYRRHDGAASVSESKISTSFLAEWKFRFNEMFGSGRMFSRLKNSITAFSKEYNLKDLNKIDSAFIQLFASENGAYRLQKVFFPRRMKQSIITEIFWRIAIALGRF